jgi:hypothetical protein
MSTSLFVKMIEQLRAQEEVMLYDNVRGVSDADKKEAIEFLHSEYNRELSHQLPKFPSFDAQAALWAAEVTYIAAQLMLYRQHKTEELDTLIRQYQGRIDASAIVSADLCLRFLPEMLNHLTVIDSEDALIPILQQILQQFSYSGINYDGLSPDSLQFGGSDEILLQLYTERIVYYKKLKWANVPTFNEVIRAQLGAHGDHFWKEFTRTTTSV